MASNKNKQNKNGKTFPDLIKEYRKPIGVIIFILLIIITYALFNDFSVKTPIISIEKKETPIKSDTSIKRDNNSSINISGNNGNVAIGSPGANQTTNNK